MTRYAGNLGMDQDPLALQTLPVKAQNEKICYKFGGGAWPPWLCLWLQGRMKKKEQHYARYLIFH